MRIDIITLFPEVFDSTLQSSILGRALKSGLFSYKLHDLRTYGLGSRRQVDDIVYGGGAGMLLMAEPLAEAIRAVKKENSGPVIALSAAGKRYDQAAAQSLAKESGFILICGRYEGIDERVIEEYVDLEIATTDAVLTGGEIPALTVIDSVVRLLPGVLGGETSTDDESFSDGLVEYPQYTRPEVWNKRTVPSVLLSGNHAEIERWRREEARKKTAKNRPDLLP